MAKRLIEHPNKSPTAAQKAAHAHRMAVKAKAKAEGRTATTSMNARRKTSLAQRRLLKIQASTPDKERSKQTPRVKKAVSTARRAQAVEVFDKKKPKSPTLADSRRMLHQPSTKPKRKYKKRPIKYVSERYVGGE